MKNYHLARTASGCHVHVSHEPPKMLTEVPYPLQLRLDLHDRGLPVFDWGDNGSGSQNFATALLADLTGDDKFTTVWRQAFQFEVVSKCGRDGGTLSEWQCWMAISKCCFDPDAVAKLAVLRAIEVGVNLRARVGDTIAREMFHAICGVRLRKKKPKDCLDRAELNSLL